MSIYQLYGSATADGPISNLDIQFDGNIVAVSLQGKGTFNADGDQYSLEVSFLSSAMLSSNDARGVIFSAMYRHTLVTSGGGNGALNQIISGVFIPVIAGERIYLHLGEFVSAGTIAARAVIYVEDKADVNLRRRR